jgi:hypothetical protein
LCSELNIYYIIRTVKYIIFLFHACASRGRKKDGFRGGMEEEKEEAKKKEEMETLEAYKFEYKLQI